MEGVPLTSAKCKPLSWGLLADITVNTGSVTYPFLDPPRTVTSTQRHG
jgi:hypothetical protein